MNKMEVLRQSGPATYASRLRFDCRAECIYGLLVLLKSLVYVSDMFVAGMLILWSERHRLVKVRQRIGPGAHGRVRSTSREVARCVLGIQFYSLRTSVNGLKKLTSPPESLPEQP